MGGYSCADELPTNSCVGQVLRNPSLCWKPKSKLFKECRGTCNRHCGVKCPAPSALKCEDKKGAAKCDVKFRKKDLKGKKTCKTNSKFVKDCRGTCNYWMNTP